MNATDTTAAIREVGFAVDGSPRRGGTATVYPGRVLGDDRRVAVKVFDASVDDERFEREAHILSTIDHHAIAPLIDFGQLSTGNRYLVTAWNDGETLAERLHRTGPLDVFIVRRVLVELCAALEHVHRRGVVHRDLSLANILISEDNRIALIDFGIARAADQPTMTATTDLVGTTRYLAPELLDGAPPSPASDQYAAAVIAYELTAGVWPFAEAPTVGQTLHHHLSSTPIPLTERVADAPMSLSNAIARGISKAPEDRFDSIQGLADAALAAPGSAHANAQGNNTASRQKRRRILAIGGVAAVALASILWFRGADRTTTTQESSPGEEAVGETTPVATWPSGLAAELDCNALPNPGFETNSLPENFWRDPNDVERSRLDAGSGVDGSSAVAIGTDGRFGAYGTVVDVEPNAEYVFSASVSFTEQPFVAEASVWWLDSNFQILDEEPVKADLLTAAPGRVALDVPAAPAEATFAVTRLYKDDSGGVLIADEVVFAERGSACAELVEQNS